MLLMKHLPLIKASTSIGVDCSCCCHCYFLSKQASFNYASFAFWPQTKKIQFCSALFTQLMMTAESMLSKRPVLELLWLYFSSLSYFRPIFIVLKKSLF